MEQREAFTHIKCHHNIISLLLTPKLITVSPRLLLYYSSRMGLEPSTTSFLSRLLCARRRRAETHTKEVHLHYYFGGKTTRGPQPIKRVSHHNNVVDDLSNS